MRASLILLILSIAGAACAASQPAATPTEQAPTTEVPPSPTAAVLPTEIPPTWTPIPTDPPEPTPSATTAPTATATETPLPAGFAVVPDVIGMYYLDARSQVLRGGFTFAYRDVFDLEHPTGTVLAQDPPPGVGLPRGKIVFLYRTFQAPPALVGGVCYPLRLISTSGKLIYYVDLVEDVEYIVRTSFPYGETHISDVQMVLLDSFNNEKKDEVPFIAPFTARYVISLGPYSLTQEQLDRDGGAVDAGCLWVIPEEGA